jgi:hypothetical protein
MTPERLKEIRERFNAPADERYISPGCVGDLLAHIDQLESLRLALESWLKDKAHKINQLTSDLERQKQTISEMAATCGNYGEREKKLMGMAREAIYNPKKFDSNGNGMEIFANCVVGTLLPEEAVAAKEVDPTEMKVCSGDGIVSTCIALARKAHEMQCDVWAEFNGWILTAKPGMEGRDVYALYESGPSQRREEFLNARDGGA